MTLVVVKCTNKIVTQINTYSGRMLIEFTDYDDYQVNLKAAKVWLAEHKVVHVDGSDYVLYEALTDSNTSLE